MKKSKCKSIVSKTIKIKIYDAEISLYYGDNIKKLIQKFNSDKKSSINIKENKNCYCLAMYSGINATILLEKHKSKSHERSTLVHECAHVAMNILNHIGSYVDYENQEPFTYLLHSIYSEFDKFLYSKKKTKTRKKK